MMTTTLGLVIIVLAWLYQLIMVLRGNYGFQRFFVAIYGIGALFLVVGGYNNGFNLSTSLNLIVLIVVWFILFLSKKS